MPVYFKNKKLMKVTICIYFKNENKNLHTLFPFGPPSPLKQFILFLFSFQFVKNDLNLFDASLRVSSFLQKQNLNKF